VECIVAAAAGRSNRDSSRESLESFLEICAHHRPQTDDVHQIPSLEGRWWHASSPMLLEDSGKNPRKNQIPSLEEIQLHNLSPCWTIQPRLVARTG
jgi:hypothetical protein